MRGVKVVEKEAFDNCVALTDVECGKLEIIKYGTFSDCKSLRSINLLSTKIVGGYSFVNAGLMDATFGKELETIEAGAFYNCTSLERITIPLKDNMITEDNTFQE
eukprot:9829306-Karenia_brevis.AAC.1